MRLLPIAQRGTGVHRGTWPLLFFVLTAGRLVQAVRTASRPADLSSQVEQSDCNAMPQAVQSQWRAKVERVIGGVQWVWAGGGGSGGARQGGGGWGLMARSS